MAINRYANVRICNKYDTAANWTTNNPVLLAGELGIESDTLGMKVGDGTSTWTALAYIIQPTTPQSGGN